MATIVPQDKLLTAEEFFDLPDDMPYELVEGRLVPKFLDADGTPMTGSVARHGFVAASLLSALWEHVRPRGLGVVLDAEVGVLVRRDPDTMRAPDVKYMSWDRLPGGRLPETRLPVPPELVAEVLSPNDRMSEVLRKVAEYLDAGVLLVWLADPRTRVVTAFTPDRAPRIYGAEDTLDGGEVLPELRIPVAPLFAFERPAPAA